ncbi:hypothetical protein V498_07096 [Pseudogymnoascus sp. VKM F-4517 (FW-2822)]|nr:hypothetical protein V498_07096 [Pseudogymnoascus sp. VKM F-4517 (FW-2822)]
MIGHTEVGSHPLARRNAQWRDSRPEKFVWLVPEEVPDSGCLYAYAGSVLIGRSEPITVQKKSSRRSVVLGDIADAEGPWFDGVQYLKSKGPGKVFVAQAKAKSIGILGGGMSGLMSAYLLNSVDFHDWKIIEASSRVGGRVHTAYLNGTRSDQYQYQEMGPMRFPVETFYPDTNETIQINDHKMVFQLADALNKMNKKRPDYKVNFIKWIQSNPNTPATTPRRLPDGRVPTSADIKADPSLAATPNYTNATAVKEAAAAYDAWMGVDESVLKALAKNVFEAHKAAVEHGILDFSEAGYLRYKLGIDPNIADQVSSLGDNHDSWYYDTGYFGATNWRTIDQGLSRLPRAFEPLVIKKTMFQTAVQELSYNGTTDKVSVKYRPGSPFNTTLESIDFDYVITAVPFSKVRLWRLPQYSSLLSRAINTLNYQQSCKIALHYKTRFWEHLDKPILGGCGSTDIPGVGSICYPSYKLNSTGPGVMLASYVSGTLARTTGSMKEEDHVALIQRAMIEVHGEIAHEQWTGKYDRHCWENDEFQSGAWCAPEAGQQALYLPAYFRTEMKTVFVGEHTSYTHAWIWSALESAVRGTTQLLLDMGLVDEAKDITKEWMARWMKM